MEGRIDGQEEEWNQELSLRRVMSMMPEGHLDEEAPSSQMQRNPDSWHQNSEAAQPRLNLENY